MKYTKRKLRMHSINKVYYINYSLLYTNNKRRKKKNAKVKVSK